MINNVSLLAYWYACLLLFMFSLFPSTFFQAEPPEIVVATIGSLTQMLERRVFKLEALCILVIDEVIIIYALVLTRLHPYEHTNMGATYSHITKSA